MGHRKCIGRGAQPSRQGGGQSPLDLAGDGVTLPAIWLCWEEKRSGASGSLLVAPQQCGSCQNLASKALGTQWTLKGKLVSCDGKME